MMSSAANSGSPAGGLVAQRSQGSSRWLIAGLLLVAAMPLTFGFLRLLQLAGLSDAMPPAPVSPMPLILHIVGALLYAVLGAFQFSASIRRRWPSWHRASGRVALAGALFVAFSALWLTASYVEATFPDLLLAGFRVVAASAMLASILLGVAAVLRRDLPRHGEWMMRSYALGLGAATQMLVLMAAAMITGESPTDLNRALLMALAWGINIVCVEWAIRRARRAQPVHAMHK